MTNGDSLIGIVGAGGIGKALARHAAHASIEVHICNSRDPSTLSDFVEEAGPHVRAVTLAEAVKPEIVIIAVPWRKLGEAFASVVDWEGRIAIDTTNAFGHEAELQGRSSSHVVETFLPGAHLVKAFNTLPPSILGTDPQQAGGRRVIFYSGDHLRSKASVGRLIERLGFAGIDLGTLELGGRLQQFPGGPLPSLNLLRI